MHSVIQGYLHNADAHALGEGGKTASIMKGRRVRFQSPFRRDTHLNMQLGARTQFAFQLFLLFTFDNFQVTGATNEC